MHHTLDDQLCRFWGWNETIDEAKEAVKSSINNQKAYKGKDVIRRCGQKKANS
jgi:hypothetical protein